MNLDNLFLKHCENHKYEINQNQLVIINNLMDYYKNNFNQARNAPRSFLSTPDLAVLL